MSEMKPLEEELFNSFVLLVGMAIIAERRLSERVPGEEYVPPSKDNVREMYLKNPIFHRTVKTTVNLLLEKVRSLVKKGVEDQNWKLKKVMGWAKRLGDYVRMTIDTGGLSKTSPIAIAYRDFMEEFKELEEHDER